MDKYTHITDADRLQIEHGLRHGISMKKIAALIGKHHSTVAREILARRIESNKGAAGRITNRCILRRDCDRLQLCMDRPDCTRRCSACNRCNSVCPNFREDVCADFSVPPYVCNGCKDEPRCVLRKRYYLHNPAHADYRKTLVESRSGANISEDELLSLDTLVSPLIRNGQSVHHILVNNRDQFNVHEKTMYRYIAGGLLRAKNGDMPRVCMLKPRSRKPVEHKVDTKCRIGRTYADYQAIIATAPLTRTVEMDTVIGRVGGKAILTLMFPWCGLMLAFLRERNDARSVAEHFGGLWDVLGAERFRAIFPLLLTDNGSEFSNPLALEFDPDGAPRSRVFYCDPCATNQKSRIERNHEFLRMILPKGTSFDYLTQDALDRVMSNINSYSRPTLGDKAPFDLFAYSYGTGILESLGMRRVPANEIVLKPALLG